MSVPCIACVDDESSIRDLYSASLPLGGYSPWPLSSGKELFELLKTKRPNLIVLDLMLGGEDGFQILSLLKSNADYASIPVIIVSAKGGEMDKVKGLNLGADDYLAKPFSIMELLARIKANLRKINPGLEGQIITYADLKLDKKTHEITLKSKALALSAKEYDLLSYFLSHPKQSLSKDDLLTNVWDYSTSGVETRTLDIHVSKLRAKLKGSEAAIETIRGIGYILR